VETDKLGTFFFLSIAVVIGMGMKGSTSDLLIHNCDEFIYYEDLERPLSKPPKVDTSLSKEKQEAFALLVSSITALQRENKDIIYSSMVKDTMIRKQPSFNESYHGYRSFSDLLEDAQKHGLINLKINARSGTYMVTGFGKAEKGLGKEA
jgi:hypothetical protein